MQSYVFDLYLPAYEVLRFYEGRVKNVRVRDYRGKTLEFAMERVLRYATKAGISGTFMLTTDDSARFLNLEKMG